ncbi:MAG: hypothetical protein QNK37_19200 [Acidobacteriota bacterium]|nr:hypothetical protein [Acidobacteriota bacterium]
MLLLFLIIGLQNEYAAPTDYDDIDEVRQVFGQIDASIADMENKFDKIKAIEAMSQYASHLGKLYSKAYRRNQVHPGEAGIVLDTVYSSIARRLREVGERENALAVLDFSRRFHKNTSVEPNRVYTKADLLKHSNPETAILYIEDYLDSHAYLKGTAFKNKNEAYVLKLASTLYEKTGRNHDAVAVLEEYLTWIYENDFAITGSDLKVFDRYAKHVSHGRGHLPKDKRKKILKKIKQTLEKKDDLNKTQVQDSLPQQFAEDKEIFGINFIDHYGR